MLVGKALYLRGGYLDNSLSFNEHGGLIGHSPQGSYTLSGVEIEKVHITKHKIELEGARYGLHFLGALAYEDPTKAVDRVKITPKKKVLKITIDRELVVTPKKAKENNKAKAKTAAKPATPIGAKPAATAAAPTGQTAANGTAAQPGSAAAPDQAAGAPAAGPATPAASPAQSGDAETAAQPVPAEAAAPATPAATTAQAAGEAKEPSEADQVKAEIAAAPAAERPADPASVTRTISPAHQTQMLKDALDKIFAQGFDDRLMASMPGYWKLYYEAVAAKSDYRPTDPTVLRQSMVDKRARLLSTVEPESNEFAQSNGVAGMAQYHVVVEPDGKVGEVAVSRPIGFGLDESAVEAIQKAKFEPAIKDGKPVAVMVNLDVPFRIYSKRTDIASKAAPADKTDKPAEPILPGPYSVQHH
ncbi:MAG: energy transducer TonB [Terracidiphilus sp.]|jgi:TonB family protein